MWPLLWHRRWCLSLRSRLQQRHAVSGSTGAALFTKSEHMAIGQPVHFKLGSHTMQGKEFLPAMQQLLHTPISISTRDPRWLFTEEVYPLVMAKDLSCWDAYQVTVHHRRVPDQSSVL